MPTIYIEGKPYQVKEGKNLLQTSLELGFNLPYFCWHPALDSVGACRQCAVKQFKDENDEQGKIVMACMTPASDGTRISIEDPQAREFRASIIEWLMVNHPHDCPVCDEGGECHLQDMTVMTGHNYREYDFQKRTYRNQDLGPFINHEMNRCIQCYRCVRFYRDYAGGRDFDVFAAHNHVYFGRYEDGALENEFSGNLVEVCPTGVFTDKTLKKHYTRKWDLQTAPSICVNCAVGCNTIPGERYGKLRRIRNRYNSDINDYFLCDRGRYGYEFVNSQQRIRTPLARNDRQQALAPLERQAALDQVREWLQDNPRMIGIGSPRASLESNFALRELVGADNFYAGVSHKPASLVTEAIWLLQEGPARPPSLYEIKHSDVVLILGEDLTNTAPMMALALRQLVHRKACQIAEEFGIPNWNDAAIREVIQHEKEMVFIATPTQTKLDDVAMATYRAAPDDLARLGFAVAHELDESAPYVKDISDEMHSLAEQIADLFRSADHPLVISGTSCGSQALLHAAANVAWALRTIGKPSLLSLAVEEANTVGLGLMTDQDLDQALQVLHAGEADTVIVLENDLYRRAPRQDVDAALQKTSRLIAIDHLQNDTVEAADMVLPATTFAEGDGTLVNYEGRAQRYYQVFVPEGEIQVSWRWIKEVMISTGRAEAGHWENIDALMSDLAGQEKTFAPILEIAPPASFRLVGQKIPRQSKRFSGRTSIHADVNVSEPAPPPDPDTPLAFSMEGYEGQPPPPLIPRFWSPGWNSIQALNKFQSEIDGPLRGGPPGCMLIQPDPHATIAYFEQVPPAFNARPGRWLVLPIYHIFGSEPLSMRTPGVAERAPQPYLALSATDAEKLGAQAGQEVELALNDSKLRLPVKLFPELASGVAGLPAGIPGMPYLELPVTGSIHGGVDE
jgi:NADH-quinone oxidoreductase subunit G